MPGLNNKVVLITGATVAARDTRRRPPYQGVVPKVRRTGSHAFWLRIVPKPPGDAPSTAIGFPPKTRPMSVGGRESQSIAFLNTPGIELYSGVARSSPSAATIALLQRRYSLWYPGRRFGISVVERNPMDFLDREFRAVGHELRRRTKQRGIESLVIRVAEKPPHPTALGDILAQENLEDRHPDDPQIQPNAYVIDIPDVQSEFFLPTDAGAPIHLRPAGNTGTYLVAPCLRCGIPGNILHEEGAGAYDTHVAFEDVPEFGKFVQTGGTKKLPEGLRAIFIWQWVIRRVCQVAHRAELHQFERTSVQA